MVTISVSQKNLKRGEFVLIPRHEYEALVRRQVSDTARKNAKKIPSWLKASLRDVEEGRVSGPFETVEELMEHLGK